MYYCRLYKIMVVENNNIGNLTGCGEFLECD